MYVHRFLVVALLVPAHSQAQPCDSKAIDLFGAARRARSILADFDRLESQYSNAMKNYEEMLPSEPGFLGGAFIGDFSGLGDMETCTADGVRNLQLDRDNIGAIGRWKSDDQRWGFSLFYVESSYSLEHHYVTTEADGQELHQMD